MEIFTEKSIKEICKNISISNDQKKIALLWSKQLSDKPSDPIKFVQNLIDVVFNQLLKLEIFYSKDYLEYAKFLLGTINNPLDIDILIKNVAIQENSQEPIQQSPLSIRQELTRNLWIILKTSAHQFGIATDGQYFLLLNYGFGNRRSFFFDYTHIMHNEDKFREFIGIFSLTTDSSRKNIGILLQKAIIRDKKEKRIFYHLIQETRTMLLNEFLKTKGISPTNAMNYSKAFLNRILLLLFIDANENTKETRYYKMMLRLLAENPIASKHSSIFFENLRKRLMVQDTQHPFLQNNLQFSILNINYSLPQSIKIFDNNPIFEKLLELSSCFYDDEINLYQLGTVFEQSLDNSLKNHRIKNENRKNLGVFYTPEYISDFLARKTIIPQLSNKNATSIEELIYEYEGSFKILEEKINAIRILDNACGAGTFLIKSTEILTIIKNQLKNGYEGLKIRPRNQNSSQIQDDHTFNQFIQYSFSEKSNNNSAIKANIYSNNIYGVDINKEAVEIAKLSIFLDLQMNMGCDIKWDKNFKIGNSLFDNPEECKNKYFDWNQEFPTIMNSGGFDVIIGNPPYIDIKNLTPIETQQIFQKYSTSHNRMNLYSTFIERGLQLLKSNGYFGCIVPNSILYNSSYKLLRIKLLQATEMYNIVKMPDNVFSDAQVETVILTFKKARTKDAECEIIIYPRKTHLNQITPLFSKKHFLTNTTRWRYNLPNFMNKTKEKLSSSKKNYPLLLIDENTQNLLKKIEDNTPLLGTSTSKNDSICDFSLGITPYDKYCGHSKEQIQNKVFHASQKMNKEYKPLLQGGDIIPYGVFWSGDQFIRYGPWLGAKREEKFFKPTHIVIRQILSGNPPRIYAGLVEDQPMYNTQVAFNLIIKNQKLIQYEYLLGLLNSDLMTFYHKNNFLDTTKILFQKILIQNAKKLPIKLTSLPEHNKLADLSKSLIKSTQKLHDLKQAFWKSIQSRFSIKKITQKIRKYPKITANELLKEIEKKCANSIGVKQKKLLIQDLQTYETQLILYQEKICKLRANSNIVVYEIYGLTKKEIEIIKEDMSII